MASEPDAPAASQGTPAKPPVRQRLALGRSKRRLSFERRLRLWLASFAVPTLLLTWVLSRTLQLSTPVTVLCVAGVMIVWTVVASYVFEGIVRPLQTLANIVACLREDDYSFRARGARRGDAMGDLALEINALAGMLQRHRSSAMDALTLADRVMRSMQSPVLAFDAEDKLRLLNAAAERTFSLTRPTSLGRSATDLNLAALLQQGDKSLFSGQGSQPAEDGALARWSVRRTNFRLYGVPHTLFVLSDVASALREEERLAWQRLIRVLGHEINNSLTPIKSIAATLRARPLSLAPDVHEPQDRIDLYRGLSVIEDRADSLSRFLQAYQELSRLPPPRKRPVEVRILVESTVALEQRLQIEVEDSPDLLLCADRDQMQQLLINLLKNATEAALDPDLCNVAPAVHVRWHAEGRSLVLQVIDNGPGLTNPDNLFVPFYTTKPQGAGIGLTLSRQIAGGHHGYVNLANRREVHGCIAELVLPLALETPQ